MQDLQQRVKYREHLSNDFDVLDDPVTREETEALIKLMLNRGAVAGLYNNGISYVVVDRVGGEVSGRRTCGVGL